MSKPIARIVASVVISLGVLIGIYTSVQGASLSARQDRSGSHLVSGSMVNLDHYRVADPAPVEMPAIQPGKGHGGCEDELRTSPDD